MRRHRDPSSDDVKDLVTASGRRKAHLLKDKHITSVGVFSTWMAFGGNTRDLGSFGEETDEITHLHQILEEVLLTELGDNVAGIMRRHRDPSSDDVKDLVTASGRSSKPAFIFIAVDTSRETRIILNSVENGPLVWPTVALKNGTVRPKTYEELSDKEKLQADYDLKATNIVLQVLPPDVYALVNHHKVSKDIWDRVKLLRQDTSLSKQERECKLHTQPSVTQNAYPSLTIPQQPQAEFPKIDSGLVVPTFLPDDDLITCMNKAMVFLSAVFTPRYPSTNNQLRSSSNLRNQATVQDGRFTIQQVQGRQGQNVVGLGSQGNDSGSRGNTSGQVKVIKCYNYQAQAEGKELDEEQLGFLADPGVANGQVAQTITHKASFQTDDLDAYDSDCDDISSAKAILMANLSSCD
nr:hypothetical protein [Tanacetum cinerariifolium]